MKKTLFIFLLGGLLMSCHSDINFNDIDTTSQVDMGIAVHVGSVRAALGDFVGLIDHFYVDSTNGGVITWRDTFPDARHYTDFDITQYISNRELNLDVYKKAQAAHLIGPNGKVTGMGIQTTLNFRLPLILKDINKNGSKNRLDSALIENARFSSVIEAIDLPLEWEWIDEVELVLGDQVYREKGNTKTVYKRGEDGNYGKTIDTNIDDFSICLMKDRTFNFLENSFDDYKNNVIDSCVFEVNFKFTIPKGKEVEVPETARFKYTLEVQFIDYAAIWGYFEPSNQMSATQEIDLADSWGSLAFLKRASTPFSDPQVDVQVQTKLAGELLMEGKYLYIIDQNGDSVFALFNGSRQRKAEAMSPYLSPDPKIDPIGKAVRTSVLFDKDPQRGAIDRLFKNMPQKMGYCFDVYFNTRNTPQIRFTPDNSVAVDAVCTLPMKFAEGLFVDYTDTIKDLDLSSVNLDSLAKETEVIDSLKASEVNLYLTAISEIPLSIKATFKYLDKDGLPLKDPDDNSKLFNPFLQDTLHIAPPRFEQDAIGNWTAKENGRTILTAKMNKQKIDMIRQIKSIVYTAVIDNSSLDYAYKNGLHEVPLRSNQRLELSVGLSAYVDALLNFDSIQGGGK